MTNRGTLAHLQESLGHLTGMERQVVQCILDEPARVLNESIHELARRCGVSESTVVRSCKRLGFEGYPQLKMSIAFDLAGSHQNAKVSKFIGQVELDDPVDLIVRKVFEANLRSMRRTLEHLSFGQFEAAVDAVLKARQVAVFSAGTDAHMVEHCTSKLVIAGVPCMGRTDHVQQMMLAAVMNPGDVLLIFGHSGRIRALVQAAELARSRGATVIAFTAFAQSPLARTADIYVTTYGGEHDMYLQAMGSQVSRMVLVDSLLVAVACRRGEAAVANFQSAREALAELRI